MIFELKKPSVYLGREDFKHNCSFLKRFSQNNSLSKFIWCISGRQELMTFRGS